MKGAMNAVMADAGHHAHPLLVRDGAVDPLVSKGMPLGMMAGISYQEIAFQLQSGDVLVFMTDGIIEAKDGDGKEYQDTDRIQKSSLNSPPTRRQRRWFPPSSRTPLPLGPI
jgi:serine phosphatase RsbU (regulator of sigma subunit)